VTRLLDKAEPFLEHQLRSQPRLKLWAIYLMRFIVFWGGEFKRDAVFVRAAGMSYTFLLALVPLLAIMFSLFTTFSAFENIKSGVEKFLFEQLVPARSQEILGYINQFTAKTKTLGFVGMLGLVITAILLFDAVEEGFNAIWKVKARRTLGTKFLVFTSVVLWAPLLIASSFYATARAKQILSLDMVPSIEILSRAFLTIFPASMSVIAFVLAFWLIPNCRVNIKSATVGGLIGGIMYEMAKAGFGQWASGAINYSKIYGSLALIPIFLVWLYLTWIIVLTAAEIAYVHQNLQAFVANRAHENLSDIERIKLALAISGFMAARFAKNETPPSTEDFAEKFVLPTELAADLTEMLVRQNIARKVVLDKGVMGAFGFVPATPPDQIQAAAVIRLVLSDQGATRKSATKEESSADEVLASFLAGIDRTLAGKSILDIADISSKPI